MIVFGPRGCEGQGQAASPFIERFHRCAVCSWLASATLMLANTCTQGLWQWGHLIVHDESAIER